MEPEKHLTAEEVTAILTQPGHHLLLHLTELDITEVMSANPDTGRLRMSVIIRGPEDQRKYAWATLAYHDQGLHYTKYADDADKWSATSPAPAYSDGRASA